MSWYHGSCDNDYEGACIRDYDEADCEYPLSYAEAQRMRKLWESEDDDE